MKSSLKTTIPEHAWDPRANQSQDADGVTPLAFGPFMCALGTLAQRARCTPCERSAQRPRLAEGGCDWPAASFPQKATLHVRKWQQISVRGAVATRDVFIICNGAGVVCMSVAGFFFYCCERCVCSVSVAGELTKKRFSVLMRLIWDRSRGCCRSLRRLLPGLVVAYCMVGDAGTVGTDREEGRVWGFL